MEKSDAVQDGVMNERVIEPGERSGVLHPANLERYRARWFTPDPALNSVVETYWAVDWNVGDETIPQSIVAAPAVTLSLESGAVPAPLVVTGVYRRAWVREIRGSGTALGIRLRPAGLAVLSDLEVGSIADATLAVVPALDPRLHELLAEIDNGTSVEERVHRADAAIRARLDDRAVTTVGALANDVVAELSRQGHPQPGAVLATRFGVSERTLQRALHRTLGHGPNWVGRWIRLQEVVRLLSSPDAPSVAEVAARLDYVDQAHLVNDFRRAVGMTPGAYVRSQHSP